MKDIITTILLVVSTFCLVAVCIWFIIEIVKDTIEERKAWKNRDELIKKWVKLDLTHEQRINQEEQFALWVAREIFDDNWEFNTESFAEIACRKLANLGIVRAKGDEWELVDTNERVGQ